MEERLVKLSRVMSYALRHHPEEVSLTLDEEGWVSVEALLTALREQRSWQKIDVEDFVSIIAQSDKKRFEMYDGMIRASYGHSIPQKVQREPAIPPALLYHGTAPKAARAIKVEGLKPMQRQYVHLSVDEATARAVALRRTPHPVILHVNALEAHEQGIKFYLGNDMTWLADNVPPRFIWFDAGENV